MAKITHKGNTINTVGTLPQKGQKAPALQAIKADLSEATLGDWKGKKKIVNIFPSIDTPVCQTSVRKFHEKASTLGNAVILNVSADLPFASKRFCAAEGIENAVPLSTFRSSFGDDWGVKLTDGVLKGLLSRAVVVLDENDNVLYSEQVPDIGQEPNYDAALAAAK